MHISKSYDQDAFGGSPTPRDLAQFIELVPGTRAADTPVNVRIDAIISVRDTPKRRACLIKCFGVDEEYASAETAEAFISRLKKENK